MGDRSNEGLREKARELADFCDEMADNLDGHTRNVNIARVTGGTVGAVGGGGASLFKFIHERRKKKQFAQRWSRFREAMIDDLQRDPERFQLVHNNLATTLGRLGITGVGIGQNAAGLALRAVRIGATAGGGAARVAAAAATGVAVLNVVLIGFSLYDIIDGSVQLHRDTGCLAGHLLRELARFLHKFAETGEWPTSDVRIEPEDKPELPPDNSDEGYEDV